MNPADNDELRRRVESPQESLDTELKPWFDPKKDSGKAVIAKACMALYNYNGGFLIIGIRDDGTADTRRPPYAIRDAFHGDIVQEIVVKYSSIPFAVTVHYIERDGQERVVVQVPAGVRTPTICRTELRKEADRQNKAGSLLAADATYVRTLNANGRPSSAPAQTNDWPELIERCFENREADVGRFIRRQLSSVDFETLAAALLEHLSGTAELKKTPTETADEFMNESFAKFLKYGMEHDPRPPKCGVMDVAGVILGEFEKPELSQHYMLNLGMNATRYSGWGPFVSLMDVANQRFGGRVVRGGWEAFHYSPDLFNILDFSRIEDSGRFYYAEGLRDDLSKQIAPQSQLEFVGSTSRITEIVATVLYFAKQFCGNDSKNQIVFAARWQGLKGRRLSSWANVSRGFATRDLAHDDDITTHVHLPIEMAMSAIGAQVESLVKPLFRLFGGWEFESRVLQQIVDDTLNRRR